MRRWEGEEEKRFVLSDGTLFAILIVLVLLTLLV